MSQTPSGKSAMPKGSFWHTVKAVVYWCSQEQQFSGRHWSPEPLSHHRGGNCWGVDFCSEFDCIGELGRGQVSLTR